MVPKVLSRIGRVSAHLDGAFSSLVVEISTSVDDPKNDGLSELGEMKACPGNLGLGTVVAGEF